MSASLRVEMKAVWSGSWRRFLSRLWVLPLCWSVILAAASIASLWELGFHPVLAILAAAGVAGIWCAPMIPTHRDMRKQWRVIEAQVIANREGSPLSLEQKTRLEGAGAILERHRALMWPAWWVSERKRVRRLIFG